MTDADALSELVRVGLRNPARIVVRVQAKKIARSPPGTDTPQSHIVEERRTPAKYLVFLSRVARTDRFQFTELLHQLSIFRETSTTRSNN